MTSIRIEDLDQLIFQNCLTCKLGGDFNKTCLEYWIKERGRLTQSLYLYGFFTYLKIPNSEILIPDFIDLAKTARIVRFEGFNDPEAFGKMVSNPKVIELIEFFLVPEAKVNEDLKVLLAQAALESENLAVIQRVFDRFHFDLYAAMVTVKTLRYLMTSGYCVYKVLWPEDPWSLIASIMMICICFSPGEHILANKTIQTDKRSLGYVCKPAVYQISKSEPEVRLGFSSCQFRAFLFPLP